MSMTYLSQKNITKKYWFVGHFGVSLIIDSLNSKKFPVIFLKKMTETLFILFVFWKVKWKQINWSETDDSIQLNKENVKIFH